MDYFLRGVFEEKRKNKKTAERGRQKREKDVRKLAAVYIAAVLAAGRCCRRRAVLAMESARTQKAALAESTETESAGSEEETALTEAAEKVPDAGGKAARFASGAAAGIHAAQEQEENHERKKRSLPSIAELLTITCWRTVMKPDWC